LAGTGEEEVSGRRKRMMEYAAIRRIARLTVMARCGVNGEGVGG